jgi:hypothetical protein
MRFDDGLDRGSLFLHPCRGALSQGFVHSRASFKIDEGFFPVLIRVTSLCKKIGFSKGVQKSTVKKRGK